MSVIPLLARIYARERIRIHEIWNKWYAGEFRAYAGYHTQNYVYLGLGEKEGRFPKR